MNYVWTRNTHTHTHSHGTVSPIYSILITVAHTTPIVTSITKSITETLCEQHTHRLLLVETNRDWLTFTPPAIYRVTSVAKLTILTLFTCKGSVIGWAGLRLLVFTFIQQIMAEQQCVGCVTTQQCRFTGGHEWKVNFKWIAILMLYY